MRFVCVQAKSLTDGLWKQILRESITEATHTTTYTQRVKFEITFKTFVSPCNGIIQQQIHEKSIIQQMKALFGGLVKLVYAG